MVRYVYRYLSVKGGGVRRTKIRADHQDKFADRIVVGYRKTKRGASYKTTGKRFKSAQSRDLGDYNSIKTGFLANGVVDYNLFPMPLTNGPMKWYSNEGFFLGKVLFNGNVSVESLNEMLNRSLNYRGARDQELRYQDVCRKWRYKYQRTGIQNGKRVTIGRVLIVTGSNPSAIVRRRAL